MFACFSSSRAKGADAPPAPPPKPPKPGGSMSTLPASADLSVVSSSPPVAPPKPKSLMGKDGFGKAAKGEFRSETDKKEIISMTGPSKGTSCITIPSAREETSKDGLEKYYEYCVTVKLPGGKTHTKKLRYSEFATFHKEWQKEYPGVNIEMAKKLIAASDEDIARRCVELQMYLREMCEIAALIYMVAKFLGVDEPELKAAIKGSRVTDSSQNIEPVRSENRKSVGRQLPKVRLDAVSSGNDDQKHMSLEKPKLPKVKMDSDPAAPPTPPKPSNTPPPAESPRPISVKIETPRPVSTKATSPRPVSSSSASNASPAVKPAIPPSRKEPEPTKSSASSSAQKTTQSTMGLSVKERMAAFQKGK